jgi:hypothetical protein
MEAETIAIFEARAMTVLLERENPAFLTLEPTTAAIAYVVGLPTPQTRTMLKWLERSGKVERIWPTTSRAYHWRLTTAGRVALRMEA